MMSLFISVFNPLENYQVNAVGVTEDKYPWIARVVHSRLSDMPYMCTAVCVEHRIFITAARCLYSLKVTYTTVIYQNHHFPVITFVVPSNTTKQAFDDIGFIVVNDEDFHGEWVTVALFDTTNRTDEDFEWFADLNLSEDASEHVVLGYATKKGIHVIKSADRNFTLTELEVIVNINICPEILIFNNLITGFHVPCYHSCSVAQFKGNDPKCSNYHGVVGGAVFNTKTNKLLGITTWGSYFFKHELPVGFSVPNSKNFFEDYTCARRIKRDKGLLVIDGYYQALCEDFN
ncbi:uncharacterized protein [Epargyreus clarus]|uniref:uncharacterized protein n=1 Tax=Epargyreus clarus TaxID=520877 RepID=UPI003C2ABA58